MTITVDIPEVVSKIIGSSNDVPRKVLEAIVADLYREGKISRPHVREVLGFTWHESEEFLARKRCHNDYSLDDLEADRKVLSSLPPR